MANLTTRKAYELGRAYRYRTVGDDTYAFRVRDCAVLRSDGAILIKSQVEDTHGTYGRVGGWRPSGFSIAARIKPEALARAADVFDRYLAKRGYTERPLIRIAGAR